MVVDGGLIGNCSVPQLTSISNMPLLSSSCAESNLNGIYYADAPKAHKSTGILWETWLGDYSLKESTMMIRSREVWTTEGEPQDP